ncbi:MAG: hypothetical protein ACRC3B_23815 [Bacteroidia bacterium]
MNIFVEKWDDEGSLVTYYTVRKEGASETETDRFLLNYEKHPKYREAVQELVQLLLYEMGDRDGAKKVFFNRNEDGSFGLPPRGKIRLAHIELHFPEFPLRLYAMRIAEREDMVVLFGGGAKTSQKNIDCRDLHISMQEARVFAKRIDEALRSGEIWVNETTRSLESDDEEILLYG